MPKHPAMWELIVQSHLRSRRPPEANVRLMLGYDDDGLGAAIEWVPVGPLASGEVFIKVAAVAMRHRVRGRGQAGPVSLEMFSVALDQMTGEATDEGAETLVISGKIHPKNRGSQRVCQTLQFTIDPSEADDAGNQTWSRTIDLRGVDLQGPSRT